MERPRRGGLEDTAVGEGDVRVRREGVVDEREDGACVGIVAELVRQPIGCANCCNQKQIVCFTESRISDGHPPEPERYGPSCGVVRCKSMAL